MNLNMVGASVSTHTRGAAEEPNRAAADAATGDQQRRPAVGGLYKKADPRDKIDG
jgi:hypothetical protein